MSLYDRDNPENEERRGILRKRWAEGIAEELRQRSRARQAEREPKP